MIIFRTFFFIVFFSMSTTLVHSAYLVKKEINPNQGTEKIISILPYEKNLNGLADEPKILRSFPAYVVEGQNSQKDLPNYLPNNLSNDFNEVKSPSEFLSNEFQSESESLIYQEVLYRNLPTELENWNAQAKSSKLRIDDFETDISAITGEVRTLIQQGPSENRINLVILGDGYTESEKEKFFSDAKRITDGLFTGQTFAAYLPLFNVYAVFTASQDSGITDGTRKRTAFGLYRNPVGSKRAIMPGNTSAIEQALTLAPAKADYPIIIANDDYYGGLGGRYAITTRSEQSGLIVLRHELGHNFGEVGEEYDGGQVYQGANSARSMNEKWSHWLTAGARVYDSKLLSGAYVWQNLDKPYQTTFQFPNSQTGGPYMFSLLISTVGWATPDDVYVYIDGQREPLDGIYTADRSFFSLVSNRTFAPGEHRFEIQQNRADGDNVLAFANLYANESKYDYNPESIAAYPNYSQWGGKAGYRPTHDGCLMRNMLTDRFCSVDKENMWLKFFMRIQLIDSLKVENVKTAASETTKSLQRKVTLQTLPLNNLQIRWFQQETTSGSPIELTEFRNQKSFLWTSPSAGSLRVEVEFSTPEIRKPGAKITASKTFPL